MFYLIKIQQLQLLIYLLKLYQNNLENLHVAYVLKQKL